MSKVWEEYKHIKCGDFLKWWSKLKDKDKIEWIEVKEKIDLEERSRLDKKNG